MKMLNLSHYLAPIVVAIGSAMAGCSTNVVSQYDGRGELRTLVWPATTFAFRKSGTFPDPVAVGAVGAAMTADQVRSLLGSPHFREGYDAREWDYLFRFRPRNAAAQEDTCRFKVVFDSAKHDRRVQAVYWDTDSCARMHGRPATAAPMQGSLDNAISPAQRSEQVAADATVVRQFDFSADVLFAFDQATMESIPPSGRERLAHLIDELQGVEVRDILITGYTDRLGRTEYNHALAERRALAVRDYLVANHIQPARVRTASRGPEDPQVDCNSLPRSDLIRCLAPNRRVVLAITLSLRR
jgi:outer membrane protein OmpA-like peptidoglycan-associated protein